MAINQYNYIPACNDTDSISFRKPDGSPFTKEEQQKLIDEINSYLPEMLIYEHDGYFESILVIKAKNYVLREHNGKVKKKGSSITDVKRELALREMLDKLIADIMDNDSKNCVDIYNKYCLEAYNIQDIDRWTTKKSITKAVLNPTRTNEQKVLDAVQHKSPKEGDKFWLYSAIDGEKQDVKKGEPVFLKDGTPKMVDNCILKLNEDWSGDEDKWHYVKRVYMTLEILKNVLDISQFTKYHLKSNRKLLEELSE